MMGHVACRLLEKKDDRGLRWRISTQDLAWGMDEDVHRLRVEISYCVIEMELHIREKV